MKVHKCNLVYKVLMLLMVYCLVSSSSIMASGSSFQATSSDIDSLPEETDSSIGLNEIIADDFVGYWQNIDVDTRGITAMNINLTDSTLSVQSWGACTPNDCDWGISYSEFIENPVIVEYTFDFKHTTNYLAILPDGRLQVTSNNVFTDGTDRDYLATWYFHRYTAEDFEGHWTNINKETGGITTLDIMAAEYMIDIHAWGACVPSDCNWGVESVYFEGNPITVIYEFDFKITTLVISLLEDGTLRATSDNIFTDNSGRDYFAIYYYERQGILDPSASDFAAHWRNTNTSTLAISAVDITTDGLLVNVQVFGVCTPTDCDWGIETVEFAGNPVDVVFDHGYAVAYIELSLLADGRLKLVMDRFYEDTRPDWHYEAYFYRTFRQEFLGHWTQTDGADFPFVDITANDSLYADVEWYGLCGGDPCSQGVETVVIEENPLKVVYDYSFKTTTVLFTLFDNGTLKMDALNVYDDGRPDLVIIALYEKVWIPLFTDWAGTWINDAGTDSMPLVEIQASQSVLDVHTFGGCIPYYCDWGVNSTSNTADSLEVMYTTFTGVSYNQLTLFRNGTMRVDVDHANFQVMFYYSKVPETPVVIGDFEGYWVNVDPETDGITTVDIEVSSGQLDVHSWGRCHPYDCDWMVSTTDFTGNPTTVVYSFSFKIATNTMSIMPDGKLKLVSDNVFLDGTNRDYIATWYFRKSNIADFEGYWTNVDENTRGITIVDMSIDRNELDVHTFGSCTPSDCDWGVVDSRFTGNPVVAFYEFSFKLATNQMTYLPDGRIMMFSNNVFIDGTDRDYIAVWFFTRTQEDTISESDFVGYWVNVNNQTRALTAMDIVDAGGSLEVRTWGACHPIDCDWGWESAIFDTQLTIEYIFSFKESTNTISLLPDGRLKAESFNTFTDDSGRGDYTSTDYFVRMDANEFLGYWANEDESANGIFGMDINAWGNDLVIETWGVCTPTPCPWGSVAAPILADPVEVTYFFSFKIAEQILTLVSSTRLELVSSNSFTDDSGRTDYTLTEFFIKGDKPEVLMEGYDICGNATVTVTEGGLVPFAPVQVVIFAISAVFAINYKRKKN